MAKKPAEALPFGKSSIARNTVTQDNALVQASYKMSLNEKRLLLLGISKVDPREMPKQSKPLQFMISAEEWQALFPGENAYREMSRAAESLLSRQATIHDTGDTKKVINWVDSCEYHKSSGCVTIRFGYSCSTYLAGMVDQFTQYDLLSVSTLTSINTIRIWELCSQFRTTGYRRMAIPHLREILQANESYKAFNDFRKWVIEPACKEITKKTDYTLSFNIIKEGRCATHIEFFFSPTKQMKLPIGLESA